jgi:hypothetical protein
MRLHPQPASADGIVIYGIEDEKQRLAIAPLYSAKNNNQHILTHINPVSIFLK